jgi:hypothetical protein
MVGLIGLLMLRVSSAANVSQCSGKVVLKQGSNSVCVKYAEQILNTTSDTGNKVKADNKYAAETKTKTTQFQATKRLSGTGIVEAMTWSQLCSIAKTKLPATYKLAGCAISTVSYGAPNMVNGCGTMQGGTTDGTYLYFICVNDGGSTMRIVKYATSGEKVAESGVLTRKQLGHANDLTYNSKLNLLVATAWDNNKKGNNGIRSAVRFIDPSTFAIQYTKSLSDKESVSNICYNPATDQYVSNGRLYDSNLNYLKKIYNVDTVDKNIGISSEKSVLRQGIGCDSSYIYVLRVVFRQSGYNMIGVYDWNGNNVGAYRVNVNDEGESLSIVDGIMYMGINEGTMSKGGDYRNDYFIRLEIPAPNIL